MLFIIIRAIGPTIIPITPITLNPVYIAIKVKIGWIPILPLTILGSNTCLTNDIIIHKTIIATPSFKSPFNASITAHGTITLPEPNIGSASTNPIASAINNGYFTFIPTILKIYNPITDITKETKIKMGYSRELYHIRLYFMCFVWKVYIIYSFSNVYLGFV